MEKIDGDVLHTRWQSAKSPPSSNSRLLGMPSSVTSGRPPRPPQLSSSLDGKVCRNEAAAEPAVSKESKPRPAARSMSQKTIPETNKQMDQEVSSRAAPQPRPRRRLASFGGVSSPGSASPFTGLGAYDQNSGRATGASTETHGKANSSLGSPGSTECLRLVPESSGRTTPLPSHGPKHLQHVRDQMLVALQKLKELEEQVKIIPVLQVKISVLQEEKRQLGSQLKSQSDPEEFNRGVNKNVCTHFKPLSEEMWALEGPVQAAGPQPCSSQSEKAGIIYVAPRKPLKENAFAYTDNVEVRSVATEVSEMRLGIYTEREAEIDAQQLIIGALRDRISYLEAELKESALQAEMSRLKFELKAAGVRARADKSSLARPSTADASAEARPTTAEQGVGSPAEFRDASTAVEIAVETVGICCRPEFKDVCAGPDVPMSRWEVRERVEVMEKKVGDHIFMITQAVGMEAKSCDAETNTEIPVEDLAPKEEKKYNSVACGDCSVHVTVCEERSWTVSRCTNTAHAFIKDSSTNTVLDSRNKHSNTCQAMTRTVSVGNLATDTKCTPEFCRGCESTSKLMQTQVSRGSRDAGVGFININDNFLVGLKTRHMASGPSHLPDPIRMRSIGVGEGRIRDLNTSSRQPADKLQPQWDPGLNHYIQKMHKLLKGQEDFVQEDRREGFVPQLLDNSAHKISMNASTLIHPFDVQQVRKCPSPPQCLPDPSNCDVNPEMLATRDSEVKRMIQKLEQQTSFVLQDKLARSSMLPSGTNQQNWDQGCSSTRKKMKLLRMTTGLNPSYKLYPVEKSNSEEEENRGNQRLKETSHDGVPTRKVKCGSAKIFKACAKPQTQPKCSLSETMFLACQALKVHLSDSRALSSKELHSCLQTVQQEWFSVSSHKAAVPDTVETYLSVFRSISPSVLRHIANMADGNGNTVLHYSVSYSNFGVVQKLLNADVCNMNHQNKAGYTPIMLAALAAVESLDDMKVVEQLFRKGDVNVKASQAGQTALMLAVSHGRRGMVQALLEQGADVNLQDDEGSTALMCAGEHGHADIVKLLLAQADCDITLSDSDGSTALSIALEAGHSDIAVLLYAHAHYSRGHMAVSGTRMPY